MKASGSEDENVARQSCVTVRFFLKVVQVPSMWHFCQFDISDGVHNKTQDNIP